MNGDGNHNGDYIYVPRKEWGPIRSQTENILSKIASRFSKSHGCEVDYALIGSGKARLVTRKIGDNRGFDFDYNLILPKEVCIGKAKEIRNEIINIIRNINKNLKYKNPEDSTSCLTVKLINTKTRTIEHSIDIAICYKDDNDDVFIMKYNTREKLEFINHGNTDRIEEKMNHLRRNNGWQLVRKQYLYLKNTEKNKNSFMLLEEAVNNAFKIYSERCEFQKW